MNKKILNGVEYTSLGLSALGTIVAATTGKIAFATSPLILSLFLNLINRKEFTQRTQQNISHQISQVENSFTENSRSLKEQIKTIERTLSSNDNSEKIRQDYQQGFIEVEKQIEGLQSNLSKLNNSNQLDEINKAIALLKKKLNTIEQQFNEIEITTEQSTSQLHDYLRQRIDSFNLIIKDNRPEYQLVFDRQGSRDVLLEALEKAQERIILVCPWITDHGANDEVIQYCRAFLNKGGRIDLGWGHLKDIEQKNHIPISHDKFLEIAKRNNKDWAYSQLVKFIELKKQYPNLKLKLLGTHEKFLVCDRTFAMIGSHNFLTSNCHSSERELGLRTNDKNIIEDLINRFENAPSLDNKEVGK